MKILDRFPMKGRGTGIVVSLDGVQPTVGQRLRRASDGREWRIESVESRAPSSTGLGLCVVGDPPAIGDEVAVCE
jgi:hypothetical protein